MRENTKRKEDDVSKQQGKINNMLMDGRSDCVLITTVLYCTSTVLKEEKKEKGEEEIEEVSTINTAVIIK